MEIVEKVLTDAFVLKPRVFSDDRGYFYESFNEKVFESLTGIQANFIQDNQSYSSKGTLRGLHFQKGEAAQAKLVRVTKGSAYDVAVDLRPDSPTFKQWHSVELSEENHLQFFIPKGFAHGYITLSKVSVVVYLQSDNYNPDFDMAINPLSVGIDWKVDKPIVSDKDLNALTFENYKKTLI